MNVKNVLIGGEIIDSHLTNIGLLLLRLFTGLALAFAHGMGKVPPSEGFVEGVAKLGFPMPGFFAWAAGTSELFGGILLAAGLFTRPSAFFILMTMLVAGFLRHGDDPFRTMEKALLFACVALLFVLAGAGKYGVDAILRKRASSK